MTRDIPRLNLLSEESIDRMHEATLEVMRDPGVRITTEEARRLLVDAGCTLHDGDVVSIPRALVEKALASAPKRFAIHDRNGAEAIRLGEGRTHVGSGVTCLAYDDPVTGERRDFTLEDFAAVARLADALPNIDFVCTPGVVRPSDELPLHLVNQHEFLAMVTNTIKPLMVLVANGDSLSDVLEMAAAVAGGRAELREWPFVMPYLNSVSPLLFNRETLDKLLLSADWGVPVVCQAAPQVGATGPATVAGTMAVAAAETLAGLVIAQLRRPGTPYITGVVPIVMDMRAGDVSGGGHVGALLMIAMAELCRRWGLPFLGTGPGSDSKVTDEQAALEITFYSLGLFLGRADLSFDPGAIDGGLTHSPAAVVVSDEVVSMYRGLLEGIDVSDESLALDAIREVGPGGLFLGHEHTLRHFRELWIPALLSWENRTEWVKRGSSTMTERARARVVEILREHRAEPLPEDVLHAMSGVIEARRQKVADPL